MGVIRFTVTGTVDGEPVMTIELTHHAELGDHSVSGMIVTAMRLVNSVHAVLEAKPGLVTALEPPLISERGLVSL